MTDSESSFDSIAESNEAKDAAALDESSKGDDTSSYSDETFDASFERYFNW